MFLLLLHISFSINVPPFKHPLWPLHAWFSVIFRGLFQILTQHKCTQSQTHIKPVALFFLCYFCDVMFSDWTAPTGLFWTWASKLKNTKHAALRKFTVHRAARTWSSKGKDGLHGALHWGRAFAKVLHNMLLYLNDSPSTSEQIRLNYLLCGWNHKHLLFLWWGFPAGEKCRWQLSLLGTDWVQTPVRTKNGRWSGHRTTFRAMPRYPWARHRTPRCDIIVRSERFSHVFFLCAWQMWLKDRDKHKRDLPRAPDLRGLSSWATALRGGSVSDRWAARWCSRNHFLLTMGGGEAPWCSGRPKPHDTNCRSLSAGGRGSVCWN